MAQARSLVLIFKSFMNQPLTDLLYFLLKNAQLYLMNMGLFVLHKMKSVKLDLSEVQGYANYRMQTEHQTWIDFTLSLYLAKLMCVVVYYSTIPFTIA